MSGDESVGVDDGVERVSKGIRVSERSRLCPSMRLPIGLTPFS